jgi:hypothetical protein
MLKKDSSIFFVKTDSIRYLIGFALMIIEDSIKVINGPKAITTQFKRIRTEPKTILAYIKCLFTTVRELRISIGNNHFRKRDSIKERALLCSVLIANVVDHEPFSIIHRDTHVPLLPVDFMTSDAKGNTLWLLNDDRLDILSVSFFTDKARQVVVTRLRNCRTGEFRISRSNTID